MRRAQFDHVITAAADVSGDMEIVVIGSQAILGTVDEPPPSMAFSMEADVYPLNNPAKSIEIDGSLGDGSFFHNTYGYYAHGVGPETVVAPAGWVDRLVRVKIPPRAGQQRAVVALCLEKHDLVLAKSVAGRARDWDFAHEALKAGLVEIDELLLRVGDLPVDEPTRKHVRQMLEGIASR